LYGDRLRPPLLPRTSAASGGRQLRRGPTWS